MRLPTSYLRHALPALLAILIPACGGAPASILTEPPADSGPSPEDSGGPVDTGTTPIDSGSVPDAEPDTAPPPSCAFTVAGGATPCFWTTYFQVLPSTCVEPSETPAAECAILCGANTNGETPDRCYEGTGASVDCYVDDECGPGGPGPGGLGGP